MKKWKERGIERGRDIAQYWREQQNAPETLDDLRCAIFEAEDFNRSYTPFELTAKEINESSDPDECWEAYDEGIAEGIDSVIRECHDTMVAYIVAERASVEIEMFAEVSEQLGIDPYDPELYQIMQDISDHGIDGGFGGFVYYTDTEEFYDRHETKIMQIADEDAREFGLDDAMAMAGSLGKPEHRATDIRTLKNWFAWYIAERVAQRVADLVDEIDNA